MADEIEHKYLVKGSFKSQAKKVKHIVQGYISTDIARTVRIRICDNEGYITIKGPTSPDGLQRYEFEKRISAAEAGELMKLCLPGVIDKHRYYIPYSSHICEIDEFHGDNEGLVIAEIEVSEKKEIVQLPPFIGPEVTGIARYYNSMLQKYPYKDWNDEEKRYSEP
ncbi:MAG TPA: adenylate cyclase [Prevotellaceae bacterium]|nr:adenylate cyclase [Prevotellaceae bacterium]